MRCQLITFKLVSRTVVGSTVTTDPKRGNVLISHRVWNSARRLGIGSAITLGLGILGFGSWPLRAIAVEPREAPRIVGPAANPPEVGTSEVTSFVGNPELKARLDLPGKLTVASERVHDQLLRRFYTAHGYQTVWTNHKLEASRLWNAVMLAGEQGLDPSLFHGTSLAARSSTLSPIERDLLLSDAFLSYADALSRGAMPIEGRADDEDLTPEPVDVVAVLDAAIANPDPPRLIEALAPSSTEYLTLRRAYAEYRAIADGGTGRAPGEARSLEPASDARRAAAERRARQLAVNLERLRWLPRLIPPDR